MKPDLCVNVQLTRLGDPGEDANSLYWSLMARRLLAFALAFVIIGGPLAADVCETVCALHGGHSIDSPVPASHHHHSAEVVSQPSHHHQSDAAATPSSRSAALMPRPHGCGHLEAIVTESRELTRAPIVTAMVMTARVTPLLVHPCRRCPRWTAGTGPPLRSVPPHRFESRPTSLRTVAVRSRRGPCSHVLRSHVSLMLLLLRSC